MIKSSWENKLFKYINGIITKKNQKLLAINGVSDHIHILISISPSCRISDLVREIKKSTNKYINSSFFPNNIFSWQEGYGVFSHSNSAIENVRAYINNQKEHHRKASFRDEYIKLLKDFAVEYKEEYLFDWNED